MNVYQLGGEVGVWRRGGRPQLNCDRTSHLNVLAQRWAGVDQHVWPRLDLPLVEHAGRTADRQQTATTGRYGVARVVSKAVRLFALRRLGGQRPVAGERVSLTLTMQVVTRPLRTGQWPLPLVTPRIVAHYEEVNRRFVHEAGVDPFQPLVKPAPLDRSEVDACLGAEIHLPDLRRLRGEGAMVPWANDQLLAAPHCGRGSMLPHAQVIGETAPQEDVIPAGDVQRRSVDFVVVGGKVDALPVRISLGVVEPVGEPGGEPLEGWQLAQWSEAVQRLQDAPQLFKCGHRCRRVLR